MLKLLFPPKCIFCRKLLNQNEIDICHNCRKDIQEFSHAKISIPFIAKWTSVWYYKGDVRKSIHRYKFRNARHYARIYGKYLAIKLQEEEFLTDLDYLSWVPVSFLRRLSRGYDQSRLIAKIVGRELGIPVTRTLRKVRHTEPQSNLRTAPERRANIINAYRVHKSTEITGKRILLIDDVVTTGATASECAKTLLIDGAKEIYLATVSTAHHDNSNKHR